MMSEETDTENKDEGLPLPDQHDAPGLFTSSPQNHSDSATPSTTQSQDSPVPKGGSSKPVTYQVLARKYRPRRFKDLIGQDAMVQTLRNSFALGRIAHAFMLTGIRGVGKTTTARIIARALNCTGRKDPKDVEPCGHCENCVAILQGRHPDVIEMDAASKTGVDDVREIIESAQFRPLLGRKKVFIIDEVHMLSRNAFNSLLKTLEEPPEHVVFIFATTELRKVPVTVISRCQRFDLHRIGQEKLAHFFGEIAKKEHVAISEEALALVARAAEGSVRDGLSLLDQAIIQSDGAEGDAIDADVVRKMLGVADGRIIADFLGESLKGAPQKVLPLMDKAWEQGVDCALILKDLLGLLHDICRYHALKTVNGGDMLSALDPELVQALGKDFDVPVLMRAWQILVKGLSEVELAPDRRAAADMVMIRLCYVANLPTPSQIIERVSEQKNRRVAQGKPPSSPAPAPIAKEQGGSEEKIVSSDAKKKITIKDWRDVVALARAKKQPRLHAELRHDVHLVSFDEGTIVVRPQPSVERDICARLRELLQEATHRSWRVTTSEDVGEATLDQQGDNVREQRRQSAARHPLVVSALKTFPGAKLAGVDDQTLDYYGLPKHEEP